MKKRTSRDVMSVLRNIQKILKGKPSVNQMYLEVQMMKFRVKPIQGDILAFNLNNEKFIETLWSLGKLDEFFQKEYYGLSSKEKDVFVRVFDDVYKKHQEDLNSVNLGLNRPFDNKVKMLEVEIFKEKMLKKKSN